MMGILSKLLGTATKVEKYGPPDKMGALRKYLQKQGKSVEHLLPVGPGHALAGREVVPGGSDPFDYWSLLALDDKAPAELGRFTLTKESMPNIGDYGSMWTAGINGQSRGKGLGQKSYQALADHYGSVISDKIESSSDALRVYDKLKAPHLGDEWIGTSEYKERPDAAMSLLPRRILYGNKK